MKSNVYLPFSELEPALSFGTVKMSEADRRTAEPASWRVWTFRIVAVLVGLFFAISLTAALQPWIPSAPGPPFTDSPLLHRWSIPLAAGEDAASGLLLVYLAWRPRIAPLFLQFYALAIVAFFLTTTPFGNHSEVIGVIAALPIAMYPWLRDLQVPPWRDGVRLPRLALALLAGPFLLADAWIELQAKTHGRAGADLSNVEHLLIIWFAMLLAASRRPGSNPLAVMIGAVLLYLGAVALTVPNAPGSWGYVGGALSSLAGLAFLLDLMNERRQRQPKATETARSDG